MAPNNQISANLREQQERLREPAAAAERLQAVRAGQEGDRDEGLQLPTRH